MAHRADIENQVQKSSRELAEQKDAVKKLDAAKSEVDAQKQSLTEARNEQVPAVQGHLKLFSNITAIKWDYDAKEVKGVIAQQRSKQMRPFAFAASATPAQVANALWDMLAEDQFSAAASAASSSSASAAGARSAGVAVF
jgi:hypothetical protein